MNSHNNLFPWVEAHPDLIYLDSASTSLKPKTMLKGIEDYITNYGLANGRSSSQLSTILDLKLSSINNKVSKLFGASNFFYSSSSTDGLNNIAGLIKTNLGKDLNYIFGIDNHHAALLPFYDNAKSCGFLELDGGFEYDYSIITNDTDVLVITACSNVLGNSINWDKLKEIKVQFPNLLIVCDGTQLLAHQKINFEELSVDIMVSSCHKMYGPDGLGLVFYSNKLLNWTPFKVGGGIVEDVTINDVKYLNSGEQYSAGSVNCEGIFAFNSILDTLNKAYESKLSLSLTGLLAVKGLKLISDPKSTHIISFTLEGHDPYDIATYLGLNGIIIRVGFMCAQPLLNSLSVSNCCRVSIGIYNTQEDIDILTQLIVNYIK